MKLTTKLLKEMIRETMQSLEKRKSVYDFLVENEIPVYEVFELYLNENKELQKTAIELVRAMIGESYKPEPILDGLVKEVLSKSNTEIDRRYYDLAMKTLKQRLENFMGKVNTMEPMRSRLDDKWNQIVIYLEGSHSSEDEEYGTISFSADSINFLNDKNKIIVFNTIDDLIAHFHKDLGLI